MLHRNAVCMSKEILIPINTIFHKKIVSPFLEPQKLVIWHHRATILKRMAAHKSQFRQFASQEPRACRMKEKMPKIFNHLLHNQQQLGKRQTKPPHQIISQVLIRLWYTTPRENFKFIRNSGLSNQMVSKGFYKVMGEKDEHDNPAPSKDHILLPHMTRMVHPSSNKNNIKNSVVFTDL